MTRHHRRSPAPAISPAGGTLIQLAQPEHSARDALTLLRPLVGRCVTLREPIRGCASYGQPGMRARLTKARGCGRDGALALTLDFSEFETFNKAFEVVCWADDQFVVQLTAHEADQYAPIEDYFLADSDQALAAMEPIDDRVPASLQGHFRRTGRPAADYTSWLEEELAVARPDLVDAAAPEDAAQAP